MAWEIRGGLAIINDELYIAEFSNGQISKLPLDDLDAQPELVLQTFEGPNHLLAQGQTLYIGDYVAAQVVTLDVSGETPESTVLIPDVATPTGLGDH